MSRSIFKRGGGVFQMPEHPTNLTFGSVCEEKDRCVLLTIALGSNYLHSRKIVKNKNTIIVFSTHEIFL